MPYVTSVARLAVAAVAAATLAHGSISAGTAPQSAPAQSRRLPSAPLSFGAFTASFGQGGAFSLEGQGWPALKGTWVASGDLVEIATPGGPRGCADPGRYTFRVDGPRVTFSLDSDACEARRMILDRSTWVPVGSPRVAAVRRIVRTVGARGPLPDSIDAIEAHRIGLLNKVVEPEKHMEETEKIAQKIATKSTVQTRCIKTLVNTGLNIDLPSACTLEIASFATGFATEDQKEGMTAFLGKRKPSFQNK